MVTIIYPFSEEGFTLVEVLLLIIIIGVMGAVAFQSMDVALESSRRNDTDGEMERLAWGVAGNPDLFANGQRTDFGYVGDVGSLPPNLDALVANPGGRDLEQWLIMAFAACFAVLGTTLSRSFLDRMSDKQFYHWTRRVILAIGVVYVSQGVWQMVHA